MAGGGGGRDDSSLLSIWPGRAERLGRVAVALVFAKRVENMMGDGKLTGGQESECAVYIAFETCQPQIRRHAVVVLFSRLEGPNNPATAFAVASSVPILFLVLQPGRS